VRSTTHCGGGGSCARVCDIVVEPQNLNVDGLNVGVVVDIIVEDTSGPLRCE
jgi:hypothetical protein